MLLPGAGDFPDTKSIVVDEMNKNVEDMEFLDVYKFMDMKQNDFDNWLEIVGCSTEDYFEYGCNWVRDKQTVPM